MQQAIHGFKEGIDFVAAEDNGQALLDFWPSNAFDFLGALQGADIEKTQSGVVHLLGGGALTQSEEEVSNILPPNLGRWPLTPAEESFNASQIVLFGDLAVLPELEVFLHSCVDLFHDESPEF